MQFVWILGILINPLQALFQRANKSRRPYVSSYRLMLMKIRSHAMGVCQLPGIEENNGVLLEEHRWGPFCVAQGLKLRLLDMTVRFELQAKGPRPRPKGLGPRAQERSGFSCLLHLDVGATVPPKPIKPKQSSNGLGFAFAVGQAFVRSGQSRGNLHLNCLSLACPT